MGIKVAICDDDKEVCTSVNHIVEKLLHQTEIKAEIYTFYSGKELCEKMLNVKYDLIFLDIEIPEMNGVEIGKYIRKKLENNVAQIVYISSKKAYRRPAEGAGQDLAAGGRALCPGRTLQKGSEGAAGRVGGHGPAAHCGKLEPAEYDRDEFADHRHGAVFPRCCLRYGGRPQQARTRHLFGRGGKAAPGPA